MVALLAGEAGQMTAYEGTFPDRLRFVTVKTGKNRPDLAQHWSGTREELFELIRCGPGEQRELLTRAQRLLHAWRNHDEARVRRRSTDVLWAFQDWFSVREWDRARDGGKRARDMLVSMILRLDAEVVAYYRPAQPAGSRENRDVRR